LFIFLFYIPDGYNRFFRNGLVIAVVPIGIHATSRYRR